MEYKTEIGTEIRRTHHDIKVFIDRKVNSDLPNHLTGIEGLLANYIYYHEGLSACDLMAHFHLQKATISEALSNLEQKKVIVMEVDISDKRRKIIRLTDEGKRCHKEFEEFYLSLIPTIEEGISKEDKETFIRVCEQIRKNVGGKI